MKKFHNARLVWLAPAALAPLAAYFFLGSCAQRPRGENATVAALRTAAVTRGDLSVKVRATGTLEPENMVDVNARVAGNIKFFGPDPRGESDPSFKGKTVDYNTPVEEGTLLAQIDNAPYVAAVKSANAELQVAKAELALAKANSALAVSNWQRAQELAKTNAVSPSELDTAAANRSIGQANEQIAEAKLEKGEVALVAAENDYDRTRIVSPIKGVVIDRRVNAGDAVAIGTSASSLFLIVSDLKRFQIWASVNEADVVLIREGQSARFTVDAFPNRVLTGRVTQIRLNAGLTRNVVLYTVVIDVDNADGLLFPYQTANVEFSAAELKNVLLVPNEALHWWPQAAPSNPRPAVQPPLGGVSSQNSPNDVYPGLESIDLPQPAVDAVQDSDLRSGQHGWWIWVKRGDAVRPVMVQIGPTDGTMTQIGGFDIKQGMQVVVGRVSSAAGTPNGTR